MSRNIYLVLQDGEIFKGTQVSLQKNFPEKAGEVVFNTTHSGYEEIATDPSYLNQIVIMTAPMQGNYGTHKMDWESHQIWIQGFVCLEMQNSKSNSSWAQRLIDANVPIMTGVDTRRLTLKLRNQGTPWGGLVQAQNEVEAVDRARGLIEKTQKQDSDWVYLASRKEEVILQGQNMSGPKVAVMDFGAKENILRELLKRCSEVKVFSSRVSKEKILEWKPDGLMLTNGPGDPSCVLKAPETVRSLLGTIPIFGICMGHQILGISLGAQTYKLKFGHRGANHPIQDKLLNKIYMSSQNHGYAVDEKTLPESVKVTQINLNDQTVAGVYSEKLRCLGIQYHPESHPGPHDAVALFDFFVQEMMSLQIQGKKNDYTVTV